MTLLGSALLLGYNKVKVVALLAAEVLILLAQYFTNLGAAHGLHTEVAKVRVHYIILRFLLI